MASRNADEIAISVQSELRDAVAIAIERFRVESDERELNFPSSFSTVERAYIHRVARALGYVSRSRGRGAQRAVTIYKVSIANLLANRAMFDLSHNSRLVIAKLLETYSLQSRERADLQPRTERDQPSAFARGEMQKTITARLNSGVAQVPERRSGDIVSFEARYATLFAKRTELLKLINEARCVLVVGEPGLGKSTQISQMIMDDAAATGRACRLIQAVPYRALALRLAERVAADRGENMVGNAVGYQVRLASRVSPCTVLTFCTNGVLLRTMMNAPSSSGNSQQSVPSNDGGSALCTATHIIVDELQVRDRFGDFALACLRDFVNKYRNVKLILIAAPSVNAQAIVTYFNNTQCHLVQLAKRPASTTARELFLDSVLTELSYQSTSMRVAAAQIAATRRRVQTLQNWLNAQAADKAQLLETTDSQLQPETANQFDAEMDTLILRCFCGNETAIEHFYTALATRLGFATGEASTGSVNRSSNAPSTAADVDYAHSATGLTMLHAASANGWVSHVEYLLNIGANMFLRAANGWTALDFANRFDQRAVVDMLEASAAGCSALVNEEYDSATLVNLSDDRVLSSFELLAGETAPSTAATGESSTPAPSLSELTVVAYQRAVGPFVHIDYELIVTLLRHIDQSMNAARKSVLVFLPSVDEIASLRNRLTAENFSVCVFDESVQPAEFKSLLEDSDDESKPVKVILTTEIAESCVTLPRIGFVIDTGVNLERAFQPVTDFTYTRYSFISKADAILRKQRLADGCSPAAESESSSSKQQPTIFRLYSRKRFEKLRPQRVATLLRSNLLDVGLYTKLLAPTNFPVADFLAKTVDAPLFAASRNAVHALKQLDALDAFEELTELGYHLLDIPLDARYAKMIVLSVVLKCVDPVLTVACFLGVRNPFLDESWNNYLYGSDNNGSGRDCEVSLRRHFVKETLAAQSNSDHMILLRAFQLWQKAKEEGAEDKFCTSHVLSPSALQLVLMRRAHVLQQLRASGFVRARSNGDLRDLNTNSENWAVVKAALVAACYPQLVRYDRAHNRLITAQHADVRFAASSSLARLPYVMYPLPTDSSASAGSKVSAPPSFGMVSAPAENVHERSLDALPSEWLIYDQVSHATGFSYGSSANAASKTAVGDAAKRSAQSLCTAKPRQVAIAHCCTVVSAVTVALFAGPSRLAALEKLLADVDADAQGEPLQHGYGESEAADTGDADADSGSLFEDDEAASLAASFMQLRSAGAQIVSGGNIDSDMRRRRSVVLHIDDLVRFEVDVDVGRLIAQLRAKWQSLLIRRLRAPNKPCSAADEAVLNALVAVLTSEEQATGLQQPSGIGQRPRPSANVYNTSAPFNPADVRPRSGSFGAAVAKASDQRRCSADRDDEFGHAAAMGHTSGSPHGSSASNSSGDLLGDTLVAPSMPHSAVNAAEFVSQVHFGGGRSAANAQQRAATQQYLAAAAAASRSQPNQLPINNALALAQQAALQQAALRHQAAVQRGAGAGAAAFVPTAEQQRIVAAQQAAAMHRQPATGASQSQVYYAMLAALRSGSAQAQAQAQANMQSAAATGEPGAGVRYFVLKGADASLLETSAETGVWPVEPNTARKLRLSTRDSRCVYLIFMLQSSSMFYGYAVLNELSASAQPLTVAQALEIGECPSVFACFLQYELLRIDWVCAGVRLPFNATHQLTISATDNRKVYLAKDGQEIDATSGATLVQFVHLCAAAANNQQQQQQQQQQQSASGLSGLQQASQSQFAQLGFANQHSLGLNAQAQRHAHGGAPLGSHATQADYALLANAMQNLEMNEPFFGEPISGMPSNVGASGGGAEINSFGLGMGLPFSGAALRPSGTGAGGFPRASGAPQSSGSSAFRTVDQSLPFNQQGAFRSGQPYAGANWQRMPF